MSRVISYAIACLILIVSSSAVAQSAPARIATEAFAGTAGAALGGFTGAVIGTGFSLLGPQKLDPVPGVIGLIGGGGAGAVAGVVIGGDAVGGDGTVGPTALGLMTGAAFSAASFGLAALLARDTPPRSLTAALVASMVILPVAGAIVGYESSAF